MGGMALLPEKFGGAQEQGGAFLPAHHVVPLIDEQRQVAVALDPFSEAMADNGLARRANGERLLQLFAASTRNPGHFGREAFDVLGLALKKTARDQQGKVGVNNVVNAYFP